MSDRIQNTEVIVKCVSCQTPIGIVTGSVQVEGERATFTCIPCWTCQYPEAFKHPQPPKEER